MFKISVLSGFSAAHHLVEYQGDCENIHGHNWKVRVTAGYENLPENGMAIDFRILKKVTDELLDELDHKDINTVPFFVSNNPTSENIARFLYTRIKEKAVPVITVEIFETDYYSASYSEEK